MLPTADADSANLYVDIVIPTNLGYARNVIVVSADAVIAISGSIGTLSEIAFALQRGIPVVGLHTWKLDKKRLGNYKIAIARTPKEAVQIAFSKIAARAHKN